MTQSLFLVLHGREMETKSVKDLNVNFLLCTFINIALIPVLLISFVYRQIAIAYLKYKYGEQFAGLMDFSDAEFTFIDTNKSPTKYVFMIDIESDSYDSDGYERSLFKLTKEEMYSFITSNKSLKKMTYTRHTELGYAFWKNNPKFDINNYVENYRLEENETLDQFTSKIYAKSLPHKNTAVWQAFVVDKAVGNYQNGNYKQFYIIFVIHHTLADLLDAHRMFAGCILQKNINEIRKPTVAIAAPKSSISKLELAVKIWKWPQILKKYEAFKFQTNAIHPASLNGEKLFVWHLDEQNISAKVKAIKNSFPGSTFMNILLTALSVSLHKFISKYKGEDKIPEYIYLVKAMQPPGAMFSLSTDHYELRNTPLVDLLHMKLVSPELSTKSKIENVCKGLSEVHILDAIVHRLVRSVLVKYLPLGFLDSSHFKACRFEGILINYPGSESYQFYGRKIKTLAFAPNNRMNTGITMGTHSYGNQLNFGLICDKAISENEEQSREILHGVINEIENMFSSLK